MNLPLFKQMMKSSAKGVGNYAFGSAFYMVLMFWLYPGLAQNASALNDLMDSMPEGVVKAFNIQGGFGSMEAFISGEYYGLILPILLSIFSLMLSTALMARLVDQGAMAYLLSAPTTRRRIASTQACVLAIGLLIIMAVTTASGYLGNALFIGDRYEFDRARFLQLNVVTWMLFTAVGGISFLVSSLANDEKKALGTSGAIVFGMFGLDLVAKVSESVEWLRYVTLFSLYRPGEIATGGGDPFVSSIVLLLTGLAGFAAGVIAFGRRDLPL